MFWERSSIPNAQIKMTSSFPTRHKDRECLLSKTRASLRMYFGNFFLSPSQQEIFFNFIWTSGPVSCKKLSRPQKSRCRASAFLRERGKERQLVSMLTCHEFHALAYCLHKQLPLNKWCFTRLWSIYFRRVWRVSWVTTTEKVSPQKA